MLVKFNKSYSFSNNGYETIHAGKGTTHEATAEIAEIMINAKVCVEDIEEDIEEVAELSPQELPDIDIDDIDDEEVEEVVEEDTEDDLTEVYKIGPALAAKLGTLNIKSFAGLFAFGQTEEGREYLISLSGITEGNVNSVIDNAKVLAEGE